MLNNPQWANKQFYYLKIFYTKQNLLASRGLNYVRRIYYLQPFIIIIIAQYIETLW